MIDYRHALIIQSGSYSQGYTGVGYHGKGQAADEPRQFINVMAMDCLVWDEIYEWCIGLDPGCPLPGFWTEIFYTELALRELIVRS